MKATFKMVSEFALFLLCCNFIVVKARILNVTWSNDEEFNVTDSILREVNATLIRENLLYLTKNPHLAGTQHDDDLADYIVSQWSAQGLDLVKKVSYASLLSYPDVANPNKVYLLDSNDEIIFTSKHMEDILRPEDQHEDFVHMYNAYGANGTVEGELVYAHYARPEDFKTLINSGINIRGKIVIARYGMMYRGNKVKLAQAYGALGLILYNDPSEYAQDGQEADKVYPNSLWLPSSGAQRGSVTTMKGDPLTPGYPAIGVSLEKNVSISRKPSKFSTDGTKTSIKVLTYLILKDGAYRIPKELSDIPKIPCQPIGYGDAHELLKFLSGVAKPTEWQETNETHLHIGPGFKPNSPARKVRLVVNNQLKTVNITNVIGIIRGSSEPDRYVLAGNHRDAWGYGAVDASGGTAQLLEVTRVLGNLVKQGWRPKRTIVFCNWGGEEFGLIGSTEWVDDNLVKLSSRAVAYINTDICTSGNVFRPTASPLIQNLIVEVSKQIPSPSNDSTTLFDTWKEYNTEAANLDPKFRKNWEKYRINDSVVVNLPGGGTDHVPFAFTAGIASVDLTFIKNQLHFLKKYSIYPVYHTGFDTFHLVDNYIDPGFHLHKACGHLNGLLVHKLADADLLPFNVTHYAKRISEGFQSLKTMGLYEKLLNHGVNIDLLEAKVEDFVEAANEFDARLLATNTRDPMILRGLNDQMLHLDQTFLLADGLPLQKQYRHAVFSLSLHNFYGSSAFPGIQDLMFDIDILSNSEQTWIELKKHVSDVIIAMHRATQFLKPNYSI